MLSWPGRCPLRQRACCCILFPFLDDYIGVFLDKVSIARLKAAFPPAKAVVSADHVTLRYQPSADEAYVYAPLFGARVAVDVTGYVEDAHAQAVGYVDSFNVEGATN